MMMITKCQYNCEQDDVVAKAPSIPHRDENELTMMALPRGMSTRLPAESPDYSASPEGQGLTNSSDDELPDQQ